MKNSHSTGAGSIQRSGSDSTLKLPGRPPFRWFGSKWRLAGWVIANMPPHRRYIEPFAGSLAVLLQKTPVHCEVAGDLDSEVSNFFLVLRERTDELMRVLRLTPYHRGEYEAAFEPATDPLERARRFLVRSWQGQGSAIKGVRTGWRVDKSGSRSKSVVSDWINDEHLLLIARRLRQVHWETRSAFEVIGEWGRAPGTLIYADPPYLLSTRHQRSEGEYTHEMSDAEHRALAELLLDSGAMAMVSGYPSQLYEQVYGQKGWTCLSTAANIRSGQRVTEQLWLSPAATDALDHSQLSFWR